jgi:hypothetical protein
MNKVARMTMTTTRPATAEPAMMDVRVDELDEDGVEVRRAVTMGVTSWEKEGR